MRVLGKVIWFVRCDSGAITVDYTVLGAAAVAMAMSSAAILVGGIENLTSQIDHELRTRQLSDDFIRFVGAHFEPLYEMGITTEEFAMVAFDDATALMNQDILDSLQAGLILAQQGQLTNAQMVELFALASVAYQRNIIDDAVLEAYFGIGAD